MNKFNPEIHHRQSLRLKGYDYSNEGLYFITICCQDMKHRFGEVKNGVMVLNEFGQVAHDEWLKTPNIRPNVELLEFVIMPNHLHGIIKILGRGESHSPHLLSPQSHCGPNVDRRKSLGMGECHSPQSQPPQNPIKTITTNQKNLGVNRGENISPLRGPSKTIGAIVRGYKSSVTKHLKSLGVIEKLWQRNYYERIIWDGQAYYYISKYIKNNPAKWGNKSMNAK